MVVRRGRWKTVCARGACPAWSSGPSTSPLDGFGTAMRKVQGADRCVRDLSPRVGGSCAACGLVVPPSSVVSSVDEQRLLELIAGSQTVSAIKLLRELTGYSLGDSTRIVEHMYTAASSLGAGGAAQPSNNRSRGP